MHVIDSLARGGAERMLVDIANISVRRGIDVHCCITRSGTDLASELHPSVGLHVLGRSRRYDLGALAKFARLLAEHRIDVLHAHSRSTVAFVAASRLLNAPLCAVVMHDHFGSIERDHSVAPWFRYVGRRLVTEYVGVSEELAQWARNAGVAESRIRIIGNRLDLQRVRQRSVDSGSLRSLLPAGVDGPVGLAVAGIRHDKGQDLLIEALALVANGSRPVSVAFVGKEQDQRYADSCRKRAQKLGLDDRIFWLGEHVNPVGLAHTADFCLIGSRSESGPLTMIEYLAAGVPIVATRTGNVTRRAEVAGVVGVVPTNDIPAIARAIDSLTSLTAEERRARGQQGSRIAEACFDLSSAFSEWETVYRSALGSTKRG